MVNSEYVLMLKDKVRPQITELIMRFNKIHSEKDNHLSMAFRLDIPSDFNPGDNIIKVITQDQKSGQYLYFADIILTIDRAGETSNIGIDVRKVLTKYDVEINEPMPKKDKAIIDGTKATALFNIVLETVGLLQNVSSSQVPRGTTPPVVGVTGNNYARYNKPYQSAYPASTQGHQTYQYNSDLTVPTAPAPQYGAQTSLIKMDTVMDDDLNYKEFIKDAPKWYRSILSESNKYKVKTYIYEIWKKTNEAPDIIWQMITGEFIRKKLLAPYCQLFPERKKFIIAEGGGVQCDWTSCPYRSDSGHCNHVRLRYGATTN